LRIPFDDTPGPLEAITEGAGVQIGLATLIYGGGALKADEEPRRTGVTVVLPRGAKDTEAVRGLVPAQRQQQNDWNELGRAVRIARGCARHHQYRRR
jgi:L-aminopeptidase/D-esterase-like protein